MPEQVTHDAATLEALGKAKLLDDLYDNQETRTQLLQNIKKVRPDARIPEIESVTQVMTALDPHLKELQATKAELAQEKAERLAEKAREKAQREYDLSDAELAEVTKLATEKKIGDLGAAVEHYRMAQQVGEPRPGPDTTIQIPSMKELWDNPAQFARNEARKALYELDQAKHKRSR